MKNKFLSLIFASCLIVPGAFALTACGEPDCEHDWRVMRMPTVHGTGATACMKCGQDGMVFPALNETDYTVSGTNPDYRLYSYVTDDETYEFYHSNFEVTYDNNLNGYSICDYLGTSSSVVIPQTITSHEGEFSVVSIRDEAFADNTAIVSVVLPDGIKELSGGAFKGCTNLSSINLPDGLTAIDNYALSQTKLSEIVVPGSVTRIGNFLENCEYVEKLSIPFVGSFPGGVQKFGNIFGDVNSNDCVPSSLKTVVITGDYDIGSHAFEECTGIESVIIEGDLTAIKQYAFASCSALKEVFVGDSVQTIEACVFENCGALERVIIPRSVTTIGNAAFYQCTNFQSVYYKGTKSEWNAISIGTYNDNNSKLNDANKYYYSQTQPTAVDYLNNNKKIDTWHYDNGEVALWQINLTNGVDAKTFNYTSSEVEVSDNYWQMLLSAKAQNALDMFFGDDQTQIDMVTSSESKADYEGKLATYYATSATALSVSFADGKATLAQTSGSTQLDYIEVDNEVYYVLTKTQAFVFDEVNNRLLERMATEYVTVTHNYLLAQ